MPFLPFPSTSLLSPPHLSPSSLPANPLRRSRAESLPLFHEFKCEKKQLELIQDEIGRDLAGEMVRMSRYLGFERWTGVDSPPNKSFFSREYFTASWPSRGTEWVIVIRINIRIFSKWGREGEWFSRRQVSLQPDLFQFSRANSRKDVWTLAYWYTDKKIGWEL